ncbi:unnamed protein product, partial [Pocillopora meandrina]
KSGRGSVKVNKRSVTVQPTLRSNPQIKYAPLRITRTAGTGAVWDIAIQASPFTRRWYLSVRERVTCVEEYKKRKGGRQAICVKHSFLFLHRQGLPRPCSLPFLETERFLSTWRAILLLHEGVLSSHLRAMWYVEMLCFDVTLEEEAN